MGKRNKVINYNIDTPVMAEVRGLILQACDDQLGVKEADDLYWNVFLNNTRPVYDVLRFIEGELR